MTFAVSASTFVGAAAFAQETPPSSTENLDRAPAIAYEQPAATGGQVAVRGEQVQIIAPPKLPDAFTLPANSGNGRRVVYSKSQQTVWALDENNVIIKMHRVSGRQDPLDPAPGVYAVYSRSRFTFAPHNPSIVWGYMVRSPTAHTTATSASTTFQPSTAGPSKRQTSWARHSRAGACANSRPTPSGCGTGRSSALSWSSHPDVATTR